MSTPVWKGQLTYGAVSFAINILTGPRADSISFNQLHTCGSRIKQVLICQADQVIVTQAELTKGYEYDKGRYITIAADELKARVPDHKGQLTITSRLPVSTIDPSTFESTYFVNPGDAAGETAYAALFGALASKRWALLTKVVLQSRERYLIIRAGQSGLIAHTLFYSSELRQLHEFRTDVTLAATPDFKGVTAIPEAPLSVLTDDHGTLIALMIQAKVAAVRSAPAEKKPVASETKAPKKASAKRGK